MIAYHPSCPACDTSDVTTFYISCQGCQTRRANRMKIFHEKPGETLPVPSVEKPSGLFPKEPRDAR